MPNTLSEYVVPYLEKLGLSPDQWGEYIQRLNDAQSYQPVDYGAVSSDVQARVQTPVEGEKPAGLGWGMYQEILKPKRKKGKNGSSDRLEEDVELLKRARLHQALAPRGLYEMLGGK